jgi:fatty-acyl-CoA synthase
VVDLDLKAIAALAVRLAGRLGDEAYFAAVCVRSGIAAPMMPHRVAQIGLAFERYGLLGGALSTAAIRHGGDVALIDERGEMTYTELDRRSNALANAWRDRGLEAGQGVAILARNHRGFLESVFAAAKCGATIILLNTSFAGPQIREVKGRNRPARLRRRVLRDDRGRPASPWLVARVGR